jgi:hypothetical protein
MSKKRERHVSFEIPDEIMIPKQKNLKFYDFVEKDNTLRKIKISIHKSDLNAFKHLISQSSLDEDQIQEIVEMAMSAKFFQGLSHLIDITESVHDIISEDFENIIEEYGLNEDSISFYFDCFSKKMFKTVMNPDNDLFKTHIIEGYSIYMLSEIKNYIEREKLYSQFKDLFLHNTKLSITNKIIQIFGGEEFKGMDKAFERTFDALKDYIDLPELQKHDSVRLVYERYVSTKNINEAFSNLRI